jgi:serine protease Do
MDDRYQYNQTGNEQGYNSYRNSYDSYQNPYGSYHQSNQSTTAPHGSKSPKKLPKAIVVTGCALLFGVVSGTTMVATNTIFSKFIGASAVTSNSSSGSDTIKMGTTELTKTTSVITSDVSEIVENVIPSVVSITNMSVQQVQNFFGSISQEVESAGTGIIIAKNDDELLIVTNQHVIEGSETLTVTFCDNTSVQANIKGSDTTYDLAVIAVAIDDISAETKENICVATLGDSTQLKMGEPAIAIGNALGYGQSVTTGVISATNRCVSESTDGTDASANVELIQTSAAINPGNSGGALVNASGEVIGINSSKLVGSSIEGVGYAIPISDVTDIISKLMEQQTKTRVDEEKRGYLGITGFDVTSEYAQRFQMPLGVYITEVSDNGGAKAAGMTKGGVITELGGMSIDSMTTLQEALKYYAIGDTVEVVVQLPSSNGEYIPQTYQVTLGKKVE